MIPSLRWILAAVTVVALVAAGCESTDKEQEKKDKKEARKLEKQHARDRAPEPVISQRPSDRDTRRTSRGIDEIPQSANRVDEGDSPRLTYSPRRDGTLYVYDYDDDRLLYSGGIHADDRFIMDPADNRATVNGRTVLGAKLDPNHRYRLYFDPGR